MADLSNLAIGVILALMIAFIGIYAISLVDDTIPEDNLLDYSYTTGTNITESVINTTTEANQTINVTALASISGEDAPTETVAFVIENANTTNITINIEFNGNSLGNMTAVNQTNTTSSAYDVTDYIVVGLNNLTLNASGVVGELCNVTATNLIYPSSTANTDFGTINDSLQTNTSTIFDVIVLVVIIFALGTAIAVLKGFSGEQGPQI